MHHVDPSKTIKAPYSQGGVVVFGQNEGQQCVSMSLCTLLCHSMKGRDAYNNAYWKSTT